MVTYVYAGGCVVVNCWGPGFAMVYIHFLELTFDVCAVAGKELGGCGGIMLKYSYSKVSYLYVFVMFIVPLSKGYHVKGGYISETDLDSSTWDIFV